MAINHDSRGLPLGSPCLGHVCEIWRVDHEQIIGLFFNVRSIGYVDGIDKWISVLGVRLKI